MKLLINITDINPNVKIDLFGDMLSYGLQIMLIGMATIFSVLIIIWVALIGFRYLFANVEKKATVKDTPKEDIPVPTYTPAKVQDAELVAVIAAAVAAAESEGNGAKFKVVSFRRK